MAQWYVKEFGKLTGVSVRTLHHYDKIGLLKPSGRMPNGYRVYTATDICKLEQIVALKFFGLSLSRIKDLVRDKNSIYQQLLSQRKVVQEQIQQLQGIHQALQGVLGDYPAQQTVDWDNVIKLIKGYSMAEKITGSWAEKVFTQDQLQQFADLKKQYSQQEMEDYQERWQKLVATVQENLDQDPAGAVGKRLVTQWFNLVNEVYGDYPELREGVRRAYAEDKIPGAPFDKKLFAWIEKAAKAHGMKW